MAWQFVVGKQTATYASFGLEKKIEQNFHSLSPLLKFTLFFL
jgi:hypothetical protein